MGGARSGSSSALALFGGPPLWSQDKHRSWPQIEKSDQDRVMAVLERGVLSGNFAPESVALQEEFADFLGIDYCLLTHSGTSALVLALNACGVGPGDEVIVPAYTFVATSLSVCLAGATPIFVDVQPDTGLLAPELLEEAIGEKTRAILPVHIHGCPADMDEILTIAKQHGLRVIEDAAQAHGATYKGKAVGTLGDAAAFSLQSSKNLAAGEGGLFVTRSQSTAEIAHSVRNFGQDVLLEDALSYSPKRANDGHRSLQSVRLGAMYRGNEMMAALARGQLQRLTQHTQRCQQHAQILIDAMTGLEGLKAPTPATNRQSVYHKFRIQFDPQVLGLKDDPQSHRTFRDRVVEALKAEGLEAVLWEEKAQNKQELFKSGQMLCSEVPSARVRHNHQRQYPQAQHLLDTSWVLFSQSCPLIAQEKTTVLAYAEVLHKVWSQKERLLDNC
jgi:perosamine synthetase